MSAGRRTFRDEGGLVLSLDRSLPIPVGVQLRGQIEYGVATGEIAPGTRLPSVRELAAALEMAPATVAQVYKELREAGLLCAQQGRGTFAPERLPPQPEAAALSALHQALEGYFAAASALGFSRAEAAEAATLRASQFPQEGHGLELAFVGIYPEATEAYAEAIRAQLPRHDRITALTFAELARDPARLNGTAAPDLWVTLANREQALRALVGARAPVVSLTMIPATETRTRLAALPPETRLAAVASLPEFVPTLDRNVGRYAPHVAEVRPAPLDDPAIGELLEWCSALVYATGSEAVRAALPPALEAFEFRYEPEGRAISRFLLPLLESLRHPAPKEGP